MATQTLSKVIIHRFMHFKHVEIKEQNCNMIDCRQQINLSVLQSFLSAFEYLFANKELSIDNIKYIGVDNNEQQENNTFVEATIQLTSGSLQTLRKSFIAETVHYQIDKNEVSREKFTKTLKDLGMFYTYASFILPGTLERIASLSDDNRAKLIDELCNTEETRSVYKRLQTQIEECREILKHRNDQIKEYTADKKAAKLNIDNESKMRKIEGELKEKNKQYSLFKIFHNKNEIESTQEELVIFVENYSLIVAEYEQSLNNFRSKMMTSDEFKVKMKESYDRFNQLLTNRLEKVIADVKRENELRTLNEQKTRMNKFERSQCLQQAQAKLSSVSNFLEELNNRKQKFNGSFNDYYKTQMQILIENPKYICYLACLKLQKQIDMVKQSEVNYRRSILRLEESKVSIGQELKFARNQFTKLQLEKVNLEATAHDQKVDFQNYQKYIRAYERLLASNSVQLEPHVKTIAESLKKQFPDDIVGILSELFETNEPTDFPVIRNGIIELLGKKASSIIVRDSKVLRQCTNFVISLGQQVDVTFVPMDAFENVSIKTIIPENVDGTPIENFIKAYHPIIKNILMEYLQPMIVCNAQELSVFKAVAKKITVTNFKNSISLTDDGFKIFSNIEKMHAENNLKGIVLQLQEMRMAEVTKRMQLANTICRLKDLDYRIENAAFTVSTTNALLDRVVLKLETYKVELAKIENFHTKDFSAHERMYAKMNEEFQNVIAQNFHSILSKYGMESMEEFLKIAFDDGNYQTKFFALYKVRKVYTNLINRFPNASFSQQLANRIEELTKECEKAEQENTNNIAIDFSAEIAENLNEKEKCDQMNEKLNNLTISCCELNSKLGRSVSDTFLTLNNILMKYDEISGINSKQLSMLFKIAGDDDDSPINIDGNSVLDILNALEVETSDLDEELRTETNIPKKTRQIELELKAFVKALEKFPVLIEGDKEGLKEINRSIKDLKTKINSTSKDYEEFTDIFKNAQILRMKNFNKCLKILNDEIAKFCRISLDDVTGELKPVDEVEPYLNKLQYFWRANGIEECLDESKNNYLSALAFLLGILKFTNQRQINCVSNTATITQVFESLQKYSESSETDLQGNILSLTSAHDFHNAIVPSNSNFIVLNHHDNLY